MGVLREEDRERLLSVGSSASEEEETDDLVIAQQVMQKRLVTTPVLQQLPLNWDRPWVQVFWGAALGLALSGILSAALVPLAAFFTDLSGYEDAPPGSPGFQPRRGGLEPDLPTLIALEFVGNPFAWAPYALVHGVR